MRIAIRHFVHASLPIFFALYALMLSIDAGADEPSPSQVVKTKNTFGSSFQQTENLVPLATALTNAPKYLEKSFQTTGEVKKVCLKKGCWLTLSDKTQEVRVTFKDYGFFVPQEIMGKKVILQGILQEKVLNESDLRHYAKDEGQPIPPDQKVVSKKILQFVADGVIIL
jgi:hypothetical protein